MRVVHIRANGEIAKSVDGVVIPCKEFYHVLNAIMEKRRKTKNGRAQV